MCSSDLHHKLVFIFQLLRTPGAALVDENQLVVASQGKQIRKKIIVRGSRTTVNDEERLASAEDSVIDHYTVRINKAFLLNVYWRTVIDVLVL